MATQTFVATYAIALVLLLSPSRRPLPASARKHLPTAPPARVPLGPATPLTTPAPPEPPVSTIRVLCLYGSIPAKGWMGREPMYGPNTLINRTAKLHGGHVGVEYAPGKVLSFQPLKYTGIASSGHLITSSNKKNFNSCFRTYSETRMWNVLGNYYGNIDSLRRAVFVIPVTAAQKKILDSLAGQYTRESPYDYAFLGMRCASATYDVLQAAGIVPEYKHELWYNVFTTRQFRYLLYREYLHNKDKGWQLYTCKGSVSRKWEKDVDNWSGF